MLECCGTWPYRHLQGMETDRQTDRLAGDDAGGGGVSGDDRLVGASPTMSLLFPGRWDDCWYVFYLEVRPYVGRLAVCR